MSGMLGNPIGPRRQMRRQYDDYALVQNKQVDGTHQNTAGADSWYTTRLNTVVYDTGEIVKAIQVAPSSGVLGKLLLGPGKYRIRARAYHMIDWTLNQRLLAGDGTVLCIGGQTVSQGNASNGLYYTVACTLVGAFELTRDQTIEFQVMQEENYGQVWHIGFGGQNDGLGETFESVEIVRMG